jgi:adenylate cyclase
MDMPSDTATKKLKSWKSGWLTAGRFRLASGLVLMLFICTHMINHALGLVSLQAMEAGREVFLVFWRSGVGTALLTSALLIHTVLAIVKLLFRKSYYGIPFREILQIVLALAVPPLIVLHVVGTRLLHEQFGVNDSYTFVIYAIWIATPLESLLQSLALLVAWFHGCMGLHFWLRLKPWYDRYFVSLYSLAIILPMLALGGFINAANIVEIRSQDKAWLAEMFQQAALPEAAAPWAYQIRDGAHLIMIGLLIALFVGHGIYELVLKRRNNIAISYPGDKSVTVPSGTSILEASRIAGVPHASVCGGRGRCSTCRVRILAGIENVKAPDWEELRVLNRVNAPIGTRLACQMQPTGPISVMPLLAAEANARDGFWKSNDLQGTEKEIVILFADLRAFTKFAEQKLPYDVVFIINQYFRHMGIAIESSGGHLDKFIGDGVMALFGLNTDIQTASRQALNAGHAMASELMEMNINLQHDLPEPLRIGVGLHVGQVIVGEMGYGHATSVTAIGDAVNTASRLEAMTKEYNAQLIFSDRVRRRANVMLPIFQTEEVLVRGRKGPLDIHIVKDAMDIPKL